MHPQRRSDGEGETKGCQMSNFNALFWGFFGTKKIQHLKNIKMIFFVFEHLFSKSGGFFFFELFGSTVGRVGREWFATRGDSLLRQPLR